MIPRRKRTEAVSWERKRPKLAIAGQILSHPIAVAVITAALTHFGPKLIQPSTAPIEELIKEEAALAGGTYPHPDKGLQDYSKLFAEGAIVLDYGTKNVWQGRTAIIDRLRPLRFVSLEHRPFNIHLDGLEASAESNTMFIQDKPVPVSGVDKDFWRFRKINGKWLITSFEYDLP